MFGVLHRVFWFWVSIWLLIVPTFTFADENREVVHRISAISDELYTLNAMGKSVCFLLLGADRSLHEGAAMDAAKRLRDVATAQAADHHALLRTVALSTQQILAGDTHPVPMRFLLMGGPQIEGQIRTSLADAARNIPQSSVVGVGNSVVLAEQASADLQGLLRDACLAQVDLLNPRDMSGLGQRALDFEAALNALVEGDAAAGVPPAPNVTIRVTVTRLIKSWERLKPVIITSAEGGEVTMKDFQKASIFGDLITKSLDKTVGYYWSL